jgi:hypothetical protein
VSPAEIDLNYVYGLVGFLIVSNIGTVGTVIIFAVKLSFRAGEFFNKITKMEKDLNLLYRKIKDIEDKK